MKISNNLKKFKDKIKQKLHQFFSDEWGGDLVEYALLIGFALFIFFILVGIIQSVLDWTTGQSGDFFNLVGGLGG